jgi:hypothetical protein
MKIERAIKSTLAIVIVVLAMRELVTGLINFRTNGNISSSLISIAVDGCLSSAAADNYLNRRCLTIGSDDVIYETISNKSSRSGQGERLKQQEIQTRLLLRQYNKEDVVRCLDSLWVQKHTQLIFAFVGDSTVRQHYTSFIRVNFLEF